MTTRLEKLWAKFRSKAFRNSFVASHVSSNIANQIATMREDRGWTQQRLAKEAGLKQSQISALENPSQRGSNLKTLLKLASACDVGLAVRFVPYSSIAAWSNNPTPEQISPPSFDDDHCEEATTLSGLYTFSIPPLTARSTTTSIFNLWIGAGYDSLRTTEATAPAAFTNPIVESERFTFSLTGVTPTTLH